MSVIVTTAAIAENKQRWTALALLCTAQFLVIMDTSIIGVALPAIKEALNYSQSGLQWIFNAYVILFGGLLLLGGRLADLYGPRKIFFTRIRSIGCSFIYCRHCMVARFT